MLDSLACQTVRANKIYINLPYKSKRTGAEYVVPSYLSRYEDVEVMRREDCGLQTLSCGRDVNVACSVA